MIAPLCLALCFAGGPGHIDVSLEFDGKLLSYAFVDVDAQDAARPDLVVAILGKDGRRHLQVHPQDGRGFAPVPSHDVEMLEDVIAYGFGDVREEAGRELILLTRSGAYSYSLQKRGYRGNIERLVEFDLLFDVPSPHALPYWPYVLEARGGDRLLLPGLTGFAIFGPRAEEPAGEREARYELIEDFGIAAPEAAEDTPPGAEGDPEESGVSADSNSSGDTLRIVLHGAEYGPLLPDLSGSESLLSDAKVYGAPAFADVNGDGERDMIVLRFRELRVHLAHDGRFSAEPDRRESFPEYLRAEVATESLSLRFEDLDGDGDPDLLGTLEREGDGFEDADLRILLLLNDGERLLPEEPDQVLRIEAAVMRMDVLDANDDGRPDLALRKFNLPSLVETVTGLEFTLTYLLFFGEDARDHVVARKPAMRQSETFDENGVADVVKHRIMRMDFDGDGYPDLVEIDLQGRIAIRRLVFDSGFFSGDTWELETEAWRLFDTRGEIEALDVRDLNGDGLGDVISKGPVGLTLLMSRRGR